MKNYTRIFLDGVRLNLRIGYYDWEKRPGKLWPVVASVDLYCEQLSWPQASMANIVDYNRVYEFLQNLQTRTHVDFLETICEDVLAFCFADTRVSRCAVRLLKTEIYTNAQGAGIEIACGREEYQLMSRNEINTET